MNAAGWLLALAQTALFVAAAPLFAGWIKRVKCWLQNRQPPPLAQGYRDLRRLFAKRVRLADQASVVFRIAPYLVFGATILAAAVTPFLSVNLPTAAITDAIALTGFFAFARFFLALAGMDIGTAFGGMGSSREMTLSALAEPAMLMALFTVAMVASSTNLATVITSIETQMVMTRPSLWFAAFGFLLVAVAETGRIPVDNPATHLELTMIHEAMILEYGGRHLGMLEWAAQLKLLVYAVLAINIFNPWGIAHEDSASALGLAIAAMAGKLLVLGIVLAVTETLQAKLRLFRVPVFLMLAFTLALGGMLSFIILEAG
ncbi:MAG: NADH-quinone oxidoreductase subunit H [Gammaproteobacteria bacterium]|nr:NADH-quinone oxidoreductase subunit H [Gammaproteobacteria bacterium]